MAVFQCVFIDSEERVIKECAWSDFGPTWATRIRMVIEPKVKIDWLACEDPAKVLDLVYQDWIPFAMIDTRPWTLYLADSKLLTGLNIPRGLLRAATKHCTAHGVPGDAVVVRP